MWSVARSTTFAGWERAMLGIKTLNEVAWKEMNDVPPKKSVRGWAPTWHGDDELVIFWVTNGIETYCVNPKNKTCSCRKWDLSSIPCSHATTCILHNKKKPENHVSDYYKYNNKNHYFHVLYFCYVYVLLCCVCVQESHFYEDLCTYHFLNKWPITLAFEWTTSSKSNLDAKGNWSTQKA